MSTYRKKLLKAAAASLIAAALLAGCGGSTPAGSAGNETGETGRQEKTETVAAEPSVPAANEAGEIQTSGGGNTVNIEIDIKDYGVIKAELYPDTAPITVENFLKLTDQGFYDGLTFHRIIPGFMIQGGDPLGNGTGGADENIKGEFAMNGVQNDLKHTRGVLSMARAQDPDSASSQFFIMHEDAPFLDGQYAAFGKVTEGIEVVDRICESVSILDDNGTVAREDQPVINSIKRVD